MSENLTVVTGGPVKVRKRTKANTVSTPGGGPRTLFRPTVRMDLEGEWEVGMVSGWWSWVLGPGLNHG